MLAIYLAPTVETTTANGGTSREPVGVALARACPGWTQSWAHIPRLPDLSLIPYTLLVVQADSHGPLDADARLISLGGGTRLVDLLNSDGTARAIPIPVATRLTALGLDPSGVINRRQLYRRIALRLEPALHDLSYENVVVGGPQTITDNFNRADGAPGANYERVYANGGSDISIVGNELSRGSDGHQMWRRISTFPPDQYAQLLSKVDLAQQSWIQPGCRLSGDGDAYYWPARMSATSGEFGRLDNGSHTYIGEATFGATLTTGNYYTFKVSATGTTIAFFYEGTQRGSTTDSTYATGKPGWDTYFSSGAKADDFECTDATSAALFLNRGFQLTNAQRRASYW